MPLRRRAATSGERKRRGGDAEPPRQLAGNERRLVETAAPKAGSVEWHRDQQAIRRIADKRRHVARHGSRKRDLPRIFEADGEPARNLVISNSRARPGDPRRPCKADSAGRLLRRLQRHSAGNAARKAEEFDLLPAVGAETMDVGNNNSASGAARRQGKVERPPRRRR